MAGPREKRPGEALAFSLGGAVTRKSHHTDKNRSHCFVVLVADLHADRMVTPKTVLYTDEIAFF